METNSVFLGTILEGYAAGLVNVSNQTEIDIVGHKIFNFNLRLRKYYQQEFPETTLKEIYDLLFQENSKLFTEDDFAKLAHITLNYVKHDIEDAKGFEKWFVKAYKRANLDQL